MNEIYGAGQLGEQMKQMSYEQMVAEKKLKTPTIGQNICCQIAMHQDAIARLEATMANLEKANLLDLKISDLREAMNY